MERLRNLNSQLVVSHRTSKSRTTATLEDIYLAAKRLQGQVRYTACRPSSRISHTVGSKVFLKLENTQYTGSYKERGALNKLMSLTEEEQKKGVCAASAGNHAQGLFIIAFVFKFIPIFLGVAYHAGRLGVKATIFMPVGTPTVKVTRTKFYGAHVVLTGSSFDDAYAACVEHQKKTGETMIHPFDDFDVIAGQGTIGLEIMDQLPDVDVLVIPIGGNLLN